MIKVVVKGKGGVAACSSKINCKGTRALIGEAGSAMAAIRATRYEKYVDWNAVAYTGLRGVQEDEG